jgi:large subunit ribosomal protein L25
MSSDSILVQLTKRDIVRKGLKVFRDKGQVPAVLHNHGQESLHIAGDYSSLAKAYAKAGKHHPVEVVVDSKKHLALIKDVDFDPIKHRMRHIVFQAIRQDEKTEAEIPIRLEGEIPAERAGLMVLTSLSSVMVEALPKDLPDELILDATKLSEVGDSLTVADLQVPAGVIVLTEAEHGVANVEMPKDQVAEANAAAEELAAEKALSETEGDEPSQTSESDEQDPKATENKAPSEEE